MSPVLPFAVLTFLCSSPWMPPDWCNTTTAVLTLDQRILEKQPERVRLLGAPRATTVDGREGLAFNGATDAVLAECNPLTGTSAFAIEMLIAPAAGGPKEQRYLHIEDESGRRVLLELRMVDADSWTLDTFIRASDAQRRTLIDTSKVHPTDRWHWVALRYDGTTMQHFVNGELEASGPVNFQDFGEGRMSVGVRLNEVSWYQGAIRELRVHRTLPAIESLQR